MSLTRLELGPLSAQDVYQIAQSVSRADGEQQAGQREYPAYQPSSQSFQAPGTGMSIERFGTWLFAETRGQPFFVRATLEALLERGVLVPRFIAGKGWVFDPQTAVLDADTLGSTLPSDVRAMIQLRLAQLSPTARELLAAGAVLDHDFTFEALCQIAQLSTQDGLLALDEAIENLLLQESGQKLGGLGAVTYVFAHDKIRELVYAEAGDASHIMASLLLSRVQGESRSQAHGGQDD